MYNKKNTWMFFIAILWALIPSTVHANDYELSIGSTSRTLGSKSVDVLSADDTHRFFNLGVAVKAPFIDLFGVEWHIESSLKVGSLDGRIFQTITSETSIWGSNIGLKAVRQMGAKIRAFAGVALGADSVSLSLRGSSRVDNRLEDEKIALYSQAKAGFDYQFLNNAMPFNSGVRAALGYQLYSKIAFDAVSEQRDDSTLIIPMGSAPLGSVDLSGWNVDLALYVNF